MKIKRINFDDKKFINLINSYFLKSDPLPLVCDLSSISSKIEAVSEYTNTLKHLDLSIQINNEDDEPIFFIFVINHIGDLIDLEFAFPNTEIETNTDLMRKCFYFLCLSALDFFRKKDMEGTIRRVNKKNLFKTFLKRYIKAISYEELVDKDYDLVFLTKESILDHCEKLGILKDFYGTSNELHKKL